MPLVMSLLRCKVDFLGSSSVVRDFWWKGHGALMDGSQLAVRRFWGFGRHGRDALRGVGSVACQLSERWFSVFKL